MRRTGHIIVLVLLSLNRFTSSVGAPPWQMRLPGVPRSPSVAWRMSRIRSALGHPIPPILGKSSLFTYAQVVNFTGASAHKNYTILLYQFTCVIGKLKRFNCSAVLFKHRDAYEKDHY